MKLWHDLGVSALLTIITTVGTVALVLVLGVRGLKGEIDDVTLLAAVLLSPMVVLTGKFWDGDLPKRKEEQANGNGGGKVP